MMPAGPLIAESVHVLVLGHLSDEFGAVGAQSSDSVVDAFDCKHDAPEARVFGGAMAGSMSTILIAKLRSSSFPCPSGVRIIDVYLDIVHPVYPVHPRASTGISSSIVMPSSVKKATAAARIGDDDAHVVQSLDSPYP